MNQARISRIEQDEKNGAVTIKTLRNVAEALDCAFVYGFVPNDSLEKTVTSQALSLAKKRLAQSNQMMRLEEQELSDREKDKVLKELINEIVNTMPKSIWDEI